MKHSVIHVINRLFPVTHGRFDVVKYLDPDAVATDDTETANTSRPSFKLGCIMLCFRVYSPAFGARCLRDFVLVREMKLAPRDPHGPFPYHPCEENIGVFDRDDPAAKNKLGRALAVLSGQNDDAAACSV